MNDLVTQMRDIGIIPVVKLDDPKHAVPLARALKDGGIPAAEITFRTSAAEESIKAVVKAEPDMLVGAGTVTSISQAKTAIAAGAKFIVCPGFNAELVDFCIEQKIPVFPGITGPSDIMAGISKGLKTLKFFPAEQSGGVAMLNAFAGPFPDISFIPTGGVNEANIGNYAKLKNVAACGGSWMLKADLIEKGGWAGITALCKTAVLALHGFTFAHVGINAADEGDARETAALLELFGFPAIPGNSSIFNGTAFEVMKKPGRGAKGHIGIKTWNVDRAIAYFARYGFKPVMETASYAGEPGKSPLKVVYLDKEINGFAFHLIANK
ncbi:MAG: bifunctional 4-hydroxy-2-oxoglutarate aldolase/2-dehydro-3-deoxy-phosphogluconate aldolase [Treponema sp.]|jgi:2-dehydro-3-deoxyphosphogluconate aldolase/(4S)-4-hydroxy-2-oxoglutarate aldolase|nr:bifunctional 4-hydroxy-2-oxoglutarate aldolase/2-dehydro-3-deoxy-phosphogluconate aldolase [Treponema sp.]